jgi:hypothetical protein
MLVFRKTFQLLYAYFRAVSLATLTVSSYLSPKYTVVCAGNYFLISNTFLVVAGCRHFGAVISLKGPRHTRTEGEMPVTRILEHGGR